MKSLTYKKAGVDITKADEFVKEIRLIFNEKGIKDIGAFGALFDIQPLIREFKKPVLVSSADGVGTKLMLALESGVHDAVGIDLVAMNVNDIICLGAKPLFFSDYIACGKLNPKALLQVLRGINQGLRESGCLLMGGETAEMPGMYKKGEYDLAGFCVGIVDKERIVNGQNIKPGDVVIGLESNGVHSNGFSLVRKVLGPKGLKKHTRELLKPTRIYVKPILSLLKTHNLRLKTIKGIAHITGGAFYNKATKILPKGLGIIIDKETWNVPKIFRTIQETGGICDKEMYTVFNMGIGMIVVVDKEQARKIQAHLNRQVKSHIVGEVVRSSKKMNLE